MEKENEFQHKKRRRRRKSVSSSSSKQVRRRQSVEFSNGTDGSPTAKRRAESTHGKRREGYSSTQGQEDNLSKKKSHKVHKVLNWIMNALFYILTFGILIGAVIFTVSQDSEKSFFGYRFYTVLTNSMVPRDPATQKGGFAAGDIIIVQMLNPKELKKGDIVTYGLMSADPESTTVLTHRVIDRLDELNGEEGLYFQTQGDANTAADRPINAEQVIGKKVFAIPKMGSIMSFLRENFLVSIGALVAIFALIISLRYYFSYSEDMDPLPEATRKRSSVQKKSSKRKK